MKKTLLVYFFMWLAWAAWSVFIVPLLHPGIVLAVIDSVAVKGFIWLVPLILYRKQLSFQNAFQAPFPWLICLVILCAVTAFLHTIRLLNGLQNTHMIFDPMFIVFSLSAGVIEELNFRGGFFRLHEKAVGLWPAALINGAMFMLYHYPALMIGQWHSLISLRSVLIFVMGIAFCWMYEKWRNLALNMTVHTVWNILSYLFCLTG